MPTILIVDDEPLQLEIFADMLKKEGYMVVKASGGEEAFQLIDKVKPDLILLDILMPRINGIDVCKIIRSSELMKYIPIIMLTALDSDESVVEALNAGADDYIIKRSSPDVISARVKAHLRTKSLFDEVDRRRKDQSIVADFLLEIDSGQDLGRTLQVLSEKVSQQIGGRISVVQIDRDRSSGTVVASSDKTGDEDIMIDLRKYPEIRCSLESGRPVIIADILNDPLMDSVSGILMELDVHSIMVIPLTIGDEAEGTLLLRARGDTRMFDNEDIRFCRIIADAVGKAIRKRTGEAG